MQRKYIAIGAVVLFVGWAWIGRTPVRAQQAMTTGADVLPALLVEVKGLRAAMEQMASSNAHAQLLVGRLQLQEGRMAGMIRRLDTVRDSLAAAEQTYNQLHGSVQMLEGDKKPDNIPQPDYDDNLKGLKRQADLAKANVDRLKAEENQLSTDLATEQGRWIEINQRLDELERSLAKR
jgi:chromosome segregation ATPase